MQSVNVHQQEIAGHTQNTWYVSEKLKPALIWLVLISAVAAIFTYFFVVLIKYDFQPLYKYAFVLFFAAAGVFHILFFPKWMKLQSSRRFIYTLFLSTVILLTVLFVLNILSINDLFITVSAGFVFLLPAMVQLCWFYFTGMQPGNTVWYMPENTLPETRMSQLLLNSIPIAILICTTEKNNKPLLFQTVFSTRVNLSVIFFRFLYDRQDAIQTMNEDGKASGWCFFVKRWYGLKNLDVNKSLEKNGVKENDTVIAERV